MLLLSPATITLQGKVTYYDDIYISTSQDLPVADLKCKLEYFHTHFCGGFLKSALC